MRGISVFIDQSCGVAGIIPADAGHFFIAITAGPAIPDHPRRCGAFEEMRQADNAAPGSSPQMRGILAL